MENVFKKYEIPFAGLSIGAHKYTFSVDESFFTKFDKSPISKGLIESDLLFDKRETMFVLTFEIGGTVNVECDRCLEAFDYPIGGEYTVYVKYEDQREQKENNDVFYISRGESKINVAEMLYDFINLCVPMQKAHPVNEEGVYGCNPKILELLDKHSSENKDDKVDPRWEQLKGLIKD